MGDALTRWNVKAEDDVYSAAAATGVSTHSTNQSGIAAEYVQSSGSDARYCSVQSVAGRLTRSPVESSVRRICPGTNVSR